MSTSIHQDDTNTPPNKRKRTLNDYFSTPSTKLPKANPTPALHLHPSLPHPNYPPGLTILPNFITPTEETHLLTFLATQPWRTDLSRRTLHYGGTYCLLPPPNSTPLQRKQIESQIHTAPPLPPELSFLISRMVSRNLYTPTTAPKFCIVNEYTSTLGISAHVENFKFAEPVVGLTLGDGDYLRFHELEERDDGSVRSYKAGKARRTGRKVDVWMEGRGLVVMRGEARGRWQHEIVRRKRAVGFRRVSLTFRTDRWA